MSPSVLFFDLFHTLVLPRYNGSANEYGILGLSAEQWEAVAEDHDLYRRRATGKVNDPSAIIDEIIANGGWIVTDDQRNQLLALRMGRMRAALLHIDPPILHTLKTLRKNGLKLCLISNADSIDKMAFTESPLYPLFDDAIFSCDVGYMKPERDIYQIAMERMGALPRDCFFIGDGGSDELKGAKSAGMSTVLSGHLWKWDTQNLARLLPDADYHIRFFPALLELPFAINQL